MPSVDDLAPRTPRDPAAFRATVLRRAARIERRRRVAHAGGWALGIAAVILSALALVQARSGSHVQTLAVPTLPFAVVSYSAAPATPFAIAGGADGNLWVSEQKPGGGAIARVDPSGNQTTFALPQGARPAGILAGADGALWFTDPGRSSIGRITTGGEVREFATPSPPGETLALGADGTIWFAEPTADRVARISADGHVSETVLPAGTHPDAIASGPDGGIWFGEDGAAALGRADPTGARTAIRLDDPAERVSVVASGPGPAVWFVTTGASGGARLGRIDTTGHAVERALGSAPAPAAIGAGPDGHLWLAGPTPATVRTVTPIRTTLQDLKAPIHVDGVAAGSDGNVWVVDRTARLVARIEVP